jgi:hypothetical protein
MSEHPILFNGDMVRAILDERKTQTRRVVKLTGDMRYWRSVDRMAGERWRFATKGAKVWTDLRCPYGQPGDRLWVRETFMTGTNFGGKFIVAYRADKSCHVRNQSTKGVPNADYSYPLDDYDESENIKWRPSIHMPRWASRITLEITDLRVERVQEIPPQDVIAEGITRRTEDCAEELGEFRELWNTINAKRGYGWDANPWVWVVTFKQLKKASEG